MTHEERETLERERMLQDQLEQTRALHIAMAFQRRMYGQPLPHPATYHLRHTGKPLA